MKKYSKKIESINELIQLNNITSVSFDIDGTVYPMMKVKIRWWILFLKNPMKALRFLKIKAKWEKRRSQADHQEILEDDVIFFENFLVQELLNENLVPEEMRAWIKILKKNNLEIYFLSDHGAMAKLRVLKLLDQGKAINCLSETGELKPHQKIVDLLLHTYQIKPLTHLHLGDRWTDEEQAKLLGSHFHYFIL